MINYLLLSTLLLSIFYCSPLPETPDLFQERTFIRENDVLNFNLKQFFDFRQSSVNFSSKNSDLRLPGILASEWEASYLEESFEVRVFKSKEGRAFALSKNGKIFASFFAEKGAKLVEEPSKLGEVIQNLEGFFCSDMAFEGESALLVLCHKPSQSKLISSTTYKLFRVDYALPREMSSVEFSASLFENPSIKLVSPGKDSSTFQLILHDKNFEGRIDSSINKAEIISFEFTETLYEKEAMTPENNTDDKENSSQRYGLKLLKESKLSMVKSESIDFSQLLSLSRDSFAIQNLMLRTEESLELFGNFITQQDKINIKTFRCPIKATSAIGSASFEKCKIDSKPKKGFFLKEKDSISIDLDNKMQFCTVGRSQCSNGSLPDGWKLLRILLEDRAGILIVKIAEKITVFMNDFATQEFNWVKIDHLNTDQTFLAQSYDASNMKRLLVSFEKDTLRSLDFTVKKDLRISSDNLNQNNKVDLYLDGVQAFDLSISVYSDSQPIDISSKNLVPFLRAKNNLFKLPLQIRGSDLTFTAIGAQRVNYFNSVETDLSHNNHKTHIFTHHDLLYKFEADQVSIFKYSFIKSLTLANPHKLSTEFVAKINYDVIDPSKITSTTVVADFIVIIFDRSEETKMIDIKKRISLQPSQPDELAGGENCKVNFNFLLCKYKTSKKFEVIRAFKITRNKFEEHPGIENGLAEFLSKKMKQKRDQISEIRINAFEQDYIRSKRFIVFFNFLYGGMEKNRIYSLRIEFKNAESSSSKVMNYLRNFSDDESIKKDAQMNCFDNRVAFTTNSPVYSTIIYDVNSSYQLEDISSSKIFQIETLKGRNLLAIVYQELYSGDVVAVLYRVTQNAVKQTIKKKILHNWSEESSIKLTTLDSSTVGMWYVDAKGEITLDAFFEEGPILISSSNKKSIIVNKLLFPTRTIEDLSFKAKSIKNLKNLSIDPSKESEIILKDFVNISGNLVDISSQHNFIKVLQPLRENSPAFSISDSKTKPLVGKWKNRYLFSTEKSNEFKLVDDNNTSLITIAELNSNHCSEISMGEKNIFCFFQDESIQKIAIFSISSKTSKIVELNQAGHSSKILFENENVSIFTQVQEGNQYVILHSLKHTSSSVDSKFIGKVKLRTDSLRIFDYSAALDKEGLFTLFILDSINARLYIYHADSNFRSLPTLRRYYSLKNYGSFFKSLSCKNSKENDIHECLIFSDSSIVKANVKKSLDQPTSFYAFEFEFISEFKNVLFEESFEGKFSIGHSSSSTHFCVYNPETMEKSQSIFFYSENSKFTRFRAKMEPTQKILFIDISSDEKELFIFFLEQGKVFRKNLIIGDYVILIDKSKIESNQNFSLMAKYADDQFEILNFDFQKIDDGKSNIAKNSSEILQKILIALVVIVSVLLLATIGFTSYFYVKRRNEAPPPLINEL